MAANKFATMLQRNTHKLVLLLVYAVLEWVLILLLLLNSLFSYFITKFATYFGLQKPCLWCSRVDHILEPRNQTKCYTDLLCEIHAAEISRLGYCSNHQKLVESRNTCGSCLASSSALETNMPSSIDDDKLESDENVLRCFCCGENFDREYNPDDPYFLFKPSWQSLGYAQKGDLVIEAVDGDEKNNAGEFVVGPSQQHEQDEAEVVADEHGQFPSNVGSFNSRDTLEEDCLSSSSMFICYEKEAMEDGKLSLLDIMRQGSNGSSEFVREFSDVSLVQCHTKEDDLIKDIEGSSMNNLDHRLIPVGSVDLSTRADNGGCNFEEGSRIPSQLKFSGEAKIHRINKSAEKADNVELENLKMVMDFVDQSEAGDTEEKKQDLIGEGSEQVISVQEIHTLQINIKEAIMTKLNDLPEAASEKHFPRDQLISRALEGDQVPDCVADKDHSSSNNDVPEVYKISDAFIAQNNRLGQNHTKHSLEQGKQSSFDENEERIEHSCVLKELKEQKEEKYPDTPTSIDSLHNLDKKWLASKKRESCSKESFDGSVVSEMEGSDAVTSVEQLKTVLKSERKALSALYAELEEERSASAIAANQTMAMITRLQEEKAAMQMEALQYQRMMEEQSEYDQEALQLLNDLMIKREKEKQELEKELEVYRKKVLDYEEKEKMRMIRRIRDGSVRSRNSSASCSHAWDSDDLSIDLNRELKDEDSSSYGRQEINISNNNAPVDTVLNLEEITLDCVKHMSILDESLTEFEEERLSILDQLKSLEDKLIKLGDEDDEFSKDLKLIANTSQSNADDFEDNLSDTTDQNGISDGFFKDNDDPELKILGSMAKKLLPLLDAADKESEEGFLNEEKVESTSVDMQNSPVSKSELDSNDKVAIEEEVDHVYERLQALEADREFLKNCMSSIKKGDKGVDLLQEILTHLRDLRTIELRMRNTNDEALDEVPVN